ncbi:hypothetical protein J6590_023503 [Homalodisca vitripennis]|nr:hypothetical protein J6590_023503 [Homalodisca vitripennis]
MVDRLLLLLKVASKAEKRDPVAGSSDILSAASFNNSEDEWNEQKNEILFNNSEDEWNEQKNEILWRAGVIFWSQPASFNNSEDEWNERCGGRL